MSHFTNYSFWALRILAAIIMLQTLYFKFSASPESVYIFTKIGMEPWGRIGIGIQELIASILLFVPGFVWLGALLGIQLMAGAVFFHLTILGISVEGDGGYLFGLALTVLISCCIIAWMEKSKIEDFVKQLYSRLITSK
jgi:hypothetical protein